MLRLTEKSTNKLVDVTGVKLIFVDKLAPTNEIDPKSRSIIIRADKNQVYISGLTKSNANKIQAKAVVTITDKSDRDNIGRPTIIRDNRRISFAGDFIVRVKNADQTGKITYVPKQDLKIVCSIYCKSWLFSTINYTVLSLLCCALYYSNSNNYCYN